MSTKPKSSLAAFVTKTTQKAEIATSKPVALNGTKKQTVRLTREQWVRLCHLAVEQDRSFQEMCIEGLSKLFTDRGLPPL